MSRKLIILLIAILLSFGSIVIIPKKVYAQGSQCYNFSDFPTGWTITQGTTIAALGFSSPGLAATDGTYNGNSSKYAVAQLNTSGETIHAFNYHLLYEGFGDDEIASAWFGLYDASNQLIDSDVKYIGFPGSFGTGTWTGFSTKDFNISADHIVVVIRHDRTSTNLDNPLAIHLDVYCYDPSTQDTATPTPTQTGLPSPLPTNTPSPSHTPLPTDSPTVTLTPSVTETPGGPSDTPHPTNLPDTPNPGVVLSGSYVPPTVVAPGGGCDSDANNPCGPMPFSALQYPTFGLSSLTPVVTVTAAGTTTGTPTFSGAQGTAIAFATGINASGLLAMGTITINDVNGTPVNLPGAANQIGLQVGDFWGAVREVTGFSLGRAGQVVFFFLLASLWMAFVRFLMLAIRAIKIAIAFIKSVVKMIPFVGIE